MADEVVKDVPEQDGGRKTPPSDALEGFQEIVGISFHLPEMRVGEYGGAAGREDRFREACHGEILAGARTTGTRVALPGAVAFLPVRAQNLRRLAAAAALSLASLAARAAEVSPEVRLALSRGASRIPVVVTLLPPAGRRAAAVREFEASGLNVRRRLVTAPVVAGDATPAAIAALAARTDVMHVGLDRTVRPAGQVGAAQIGADRLLGIGVTGLGRSVAVVDSGIDLQHPDLRNPAGTPWPGFDVAEGTADLADCSGHGTEVAGVLAGPQGVAPDAGLVVLKVFSARDGCTTALASDVLAAMEWAIAYAPGTDLEAVNLSLADDAVHAGFCDADDPAGAAVFASARDAGLSVAAAAGNAGKTAGLPWPACLSSVASVGMVYSLANGPVQWGGSASCTDISTGPDVVPCASNTGSGLSVLAPGVGWTTTAEGGGQTSGFSGTSAAAPVTAGALLLARQARPLADPGLAIDLLRATGVPVRDARTGLTAPRVDLAAAIDASTPVAGGCANAPIPDGAGSLVCDAVVSSLVGNVSTLFLALAIDHPDRTQLAVTLAGPDGTEVKVVDHEGRAGEALREVFGLTDASAEALSAFAGRPLDGTWRLSVTDTVPGGTGRVVSWALFVEPSIPEPEPAFPAATSFVATTVHRIGRLGAFYTTDLRLFNADPAAAHDVLLRFAPAAQGLPRTVAVTLAPLATRVLDDVVHDAFRMDGYGPIFLNAGPAVVAATRTSTTAPRGGSFGLSLPADAVTSAAGAGSTLVLVPSFRANGFRVNVGVTEVSGKSASVEVALRDSSGALRALVPRLVPAGGLVQLNDIYSLTNLAPDPADRIEVRVTDGAGKVAAWATPVDDSTNDGSFVAAHPAAPRILIPAVVRTTAPPGPPTTTDLKLSNAGAASTRVQVALLPLSGSSVAPATATVTLAPNETRAFDDVLGTLLGAGDASGALRITSLDGGAVYASARTSTADGVRSYGFAIDPSAASAQAGPGRQLALTFLSSSPSRRTNVGLVEAGGFKTLVRVSLLAPDGTVTATKDLSLEPFGAVRWDDVFAAMQAPPLPDASLVVDVLSGGSAVAYAIGVDTRTGDASYFASSLVPAPAP